MKKITSILFTLFLLFTFYGFVYGQSENDPLDKTEGPFMNLHLNGNYFNTSINNGIFGGFAGGRLGLAFQRVSIYTGVSLAVLNGNRFRDGFMDEAVLYLNFEIVGVQYHFLTKDPALIPYVDASFSIFAFSTPRDEEGNLTSLIGVPAIGGTGGGGVKYFIARTFSLDAGLSLSYLSFEENNHGLNVQLNAGFSWYPLNW